MGGSAEGDSVIINVSRSDYREAPSAYLTRDEARDLLCRVLMQLGTIQETVGDSAGAAIDIAKITFEEMLVAQRRGDKLAYMLAERGGDTRRLRAAEDGLGFVMGTATAEQLCRRGVDYANAIRDLGGDIDAVGKPTEPRFRAK